MTAAWRLLGERPGSAGYLPIVARDYRLPDGTNATWDIFGYERSVAVVAITSGGEVVLARQYRPGPDRILDELPGGLVEPGEDVADAATRELLEETGYSGAIMVVASSWLASTSRTQRFATVARGAEPIAEPGASRGSL